MGGQVVSPSYRAPDCLLKPDVEAVNLYRSSVVWSQEVPKLSVRFNIRRRLLVEIPSKASRICVLTGCCSDMKFRYSIGK